MNETEFLNCANAWFSKAENVLEEADARSELEMDSQNESLTLHFPNGKTIVISKHRVNRQIWLASPHAGGLHFSFRDGHWMLADGRTLEDVLTQELNVLANITLTWA